MIGAEQDVADALDDVGASDFPAALRRGDFDPRLLRAHDVGPLAAVEQFDAHKHVGDRQLQARELEALARKPRAPGIDASPFEQ